MNGGEMADRSKFALLSLLVALFTFLPASIARGDAWDKETIVTMRNRTKLAAHPIRWRRWCRLLWTGRRQPCCRAWTMPDWAGVAVTRVAGSDAHQLGEKSWAR